MRYRTVCRVPEKDLEKWQKYGSNKIVEETYSNGTYRGCIKNGKREGHGTYFYTSGSRYEGNGRMITRKVMESSIGKMAATMKGNGRMATKKVMESSIGKMAIAMKGNGRMTTRKVKAPIST